MRPTALNFQVNDICNARCVMCHVWQHKRDREMSPREFATLLSDPYFSDLEHVGITGGEPTLCRNLDEYYLLLPDVCPKLKGASFITHGFDTDRAVGIYSRVASAYRARGLDFHGMVSLDGVGEVHDRVRGRSGAFERATRTLFGLKMVGVPTSACCTIVASNVRDIWTLLEWGYDKTYIRFRVGEFINRLSNHEAAHEIRAFDATARIDLISFFEHLIQSYEPDETVKRTYASIIALVGGGSRLIGCPYQDGRAVNVDCRGQFAVCAPKGQPHPLGTDAEAAVRTADAERRSIVRRHCAGCIHDYHDDWTPAVAASRRSATATLRTLEAAAVTPILSPPASPSIHPSRVLVLGWYGTETIGDQAILAGLVDEYRRKTPDATFIVPSQYPFYTRVNLERLGLDCHVTSYGDEQLTGDLWGCGTVMIGGGPLMDIPQLAWLATIFEQARAKGRRTVVEGCGIGPVNLPETAAHIGRIARAAHEIRLRDRSSARRLRALGYEGDVTVVDDPAARWARSQGVRHHGTDAGPICVFARELTHEYPQATSPADATDALATFLARLSDWFPDRALRLHAMHHFPVGGDDRVYARRLTRLIGNERCSVDDTPRTPAETLAIMARASLVIAMRFHAVVFAHTIGAPMVAIDYTNGGKVAGYLSEHDLAERKLTFDELARLERQDLVERSLGVETARP